MSEFTRQLAEWAVLGFEAVGAVLIVALALFALSHGAMSLLRGDDVSEVYRRVRQQLGRGILLGLEFLVAADIVHTVAVDLSFSTVGVLAVVVLIRTFLSFTLEVELTGRWPWQSEASKGTS